MKATFDLSKRDYRLFQRFVMFRYRKLHWILIALWAYQTWRVAKEPPQTPEMAAGPVIWFISSAISVAVVMTLLFFFAFAVLRLLSRGPRPVCGHHEWEIDGDTIIETNDEGTTTTPLEPITAHETREHIFLLRPSGIATIIPKAATADDPAFFDELRKRTKGNDKL